ncbi:prolipoprotein diacylglyceryl transferase [Streptomyces lincolnensis]|uniref:Phosphatidylglycerol--prolipoprotein diacylglyceryl transferase n=1 Tax=Streptomyces lincolnensis TaxID=1915 RepID=A0A1B1M306_STRLN|nr:prolipoprotein diacylglyceryl transferase [Streptomyces lincolnensis]ANS62854.1 prolipoprotein diacylglyceryl transferase [Streptomyces lincolnensis]AXG51778.1 prolipoprotein diacylglyceryl transferase [Streptomyces lincolnensis]QMV04790.1 prolipoprotein diacylglyceryl transferase [Streptomyces lincolnensis]
MSLAFIPSPSTGELHLGPLPLRGYSLLLILGIAAAIWLGTRRWVARGGEKSTVSDIALWAIPFGIIGARLYHVITTSGPYFGDGGDPVKALYIWEGGISIWGAVAGGAVGAWIGCRRKGVDLAAFADAVAPGIALGQAIGRWGNWFNQELYGRATTLPWGLEIDAEHRPEGMQDVATYHPTFLYESLWNLGVVALLIWADRLFRLDRGRAFALYAAAYTAGRFWIEYLRVDESHEILGLRLNDWTSLLVFAAAVTYLAVMRRRPAPDRAATDSGSLRGREAVDSGRTGS